MSKLLIFRFLAFAVAILLILAGFTYLFSPRILPYHEQFLGKKFQQLDERPAILAVTAMHILGAAFLTLGVLQSLICWPKIKIPVRNQRLFFWIFLALFFFPVILFTWKINMTIPCLVMSSAGLLEAAALFLLYSMKD